MALSIAVLADDLTGAADTAVAFTRPGRPVPVHQLVPDAPCAPVFAVDLDVRDAPPGLDVQAVYAKQAARVPTTHAVYVKIDSTLRGRIREALAGVAAALPDRPMICAPGFPAVGRTVHESVVHVHGVPLHHSGIWAAEPTATPLSIGAVLPASPSASLSVDDVRAGAVEVALGAARAPLLLCDTADDADLLRVARAGRSAGRPPIWVGSAGLAHALAAVDRRADRTETGAVPDATGRPSRFLAVVGSASELARSQVQALAAAGANWFSVTTGYLTSTAEPELSERAGEIAAAAALGPTVVSLDSDPIGIDPSDPVRRSRLAVALAHLVTPATEVTDLLVLTGGATARAVLTAGGIAGLAVERELSHGVVASSAYDARHRPLRVITKAGAFGDERTLIDLLYPCSPPNRSAMNTKPVVGITMGDAAGIGPEVVVKALMHREVAELCHAVVIGDLGRLVEAATLCGLDLEFRSIEHPDEVLDDGRAQVIDVGGIPSGLPFGEISLAAGDGAYRYVQKAAELALDHSIDAICTAPLNKEAMQAAGHMFPGHTELLAALTGVPEVSMLLSSERLRVIHVTTHVGLIDAVDLINSGLVLRTIQRGHRTLVDAGIPNPRIAVCGINPHAGENGLFGRGEEKSKVVPGVELAVAEGIDAVGPLPADTVFFRAGRGDFDMVVAMYHDQGHGPVKMLGLDVGVNITVGLPVVRTSVDHGTAFDIAGTGAADEASMLEALRQAVVLAPRRAAIRRDLESR